MYRLCFLFVVLGLNACTRQQSQAPPSATSNDQNARAVPAQIASGEVRVSPSDPKVGTPVEVVMKLKDSKGEMISDANVQAVFVMKMGNTTTREPAAMQWKGSDYVGRYTPTMTGEWEVNVEARRNGQLLLSMPSTIEVKK